MKLKTLLVSVATLCIALLAVSCAGSRNPSETNPRPTDPTSSSTPSSSAALTTRLTTTKKETTRRTTTKKETTRITTTQRVMTTRRTTTRRTTTKRTTTVTTNIDKLFAVLPEKLPDGAYYNISDRVGFDSYDEFISVSGNFANGDFTSDGAIFGSAWRMEVDPTLISYGDKSPRAEAYFDLVIPPSIENVKGVMWYVDFSAVDAVDGTLCASTTINGNLYRSHKGNSSARLATGYYYQNGEWVATENITSCRMQIPDGFVGWMYVPLTSYNGAGELYDSFTGRGNALWVTNIRLYTDGYVYDIGKPIIFDELLYVD